jgi:anti-anti-sigma regulatory factor
MLLPEMAEQEQALPVTLDRNDATSTVQLNGDIDIGAALELKALFVDALADARELRVQLDGATSLDITIFQLIWVARREAARAGIEFSVEGHVPEKIALALAEAGLEAFQVNPS